MANTISRADAIWHGSVISRFEYQNCKNLGIDRPVTVVIVRSPDDRKIVNPSGLETFISVDSAPTDMTITTTRFPVKQGDIIAAVSYKAPKREREDAIVFEIVRTIARTHGFGKPEETSATYMMDVLGYNRRQIMAFLKLLNRRTEKEVNAFLKQKESGMHATASACRAKPVQLEVESESPFEAAFNASFTDADTWDTSASMASLGKKLGAQECRQESEIQNGFRRIGELHDELVKKWGYLEEMDDNFPEDPPFEEEVTPPAPKTAEQRERELRKAVALSNLSAEEQREIFNTLKWKKRVERDEREKATKSAAPQTQPKQQTQTQTQQAQPAKQQQPQTQQAQPAKQQPQNHQKRSKKKKKAIVNNIVNNTAQLAAALQSPAPTT